MTYTNPFEQHETETLVEDKFSNKLVVHNDDHNTFDWVADALIDVCNQTLVQAEQCAMIIHTKGKYAVKEGDYKKLKPLREAIVERGINATID
ncbi:MAG: ATP-dependent Clp protease adaptor protein ClpS [Planctomycetota bacterium]|jgi:ATP-dependent Clp protease adaptor protein ClpS